jgi:hypothetical protein
MLPPAAKKGRAGLAAARAGLKADLDRLENVLPIDDKENQGKDLLLEKLFKVRPDNTTTIVVH